MTFPQDFQITYTKIDEGQDSVDSFSLIESTIRENEKYSIQFILDNSLPIIKGDQKIIKPILRDFVISAIEEFKDKKGTLHFRYRRDLDLSILVFFTQNLLFNRDTASNIIDCISDLNLAICKKTLNEGELNITRNDDQKQAPFLS